MKNTQQGFIPIIIAVIVVAALAVGGTYYASKKKAPVVTTDTQATTTISGEVSGNTNVGATSSAATGVSAGETLRTLLADGKNTMCTFKSADAKVDASGTVYISGTNMRGDFTMSGSGSSAIESHMIKQGDIVYAWSGSQGAKMTFATVSGNTSGQQAVNLDQKIDYKCSPWTPDASKFTLPTATTFIDINAAVQGNLDKLNIQGQAGAKVSN